MKKTLQNARDKGFSLMEYVIGLAVLSALVYAGMEALGKGYNDYLNGLGEYLGDQEMPSNTGASSS